MTGTNVGHNVTGSLGVLVKAKQKGLIENVGTLMDKLIEEGLYVDQKTRRIVLKMAGE